MKKLLQYLWWKCKALLMMSVGYYRHSQERACPSIPDEYFLQQQEIYRFVAQAVNGKTVLDLGCGTGFGAHLLRESGAKSVFAVDISKGALSYARRRYPPAEMFRQMDAHEISYPNESFDVVAVVGLIEHLAQPEKCLTHIKRTLKKGGTVILSTPNKEVVSPGNEKPANPYRIKEYTFEELQALMQKVFRNVQIIESTSKTSSYVGYKLKEERRSKNRVGIEIEGKSTTQIGRLRFDVSSLQKIDSFILVAW